MDFSTVFIPQDSVTVRQAAAEAYAYSQKDNIVESHLYSTAYAIKAVAVSFFCAFSYMARSVGHVMTHSTELDFNALAIDFGKDNLYALQSILLSAFGTFYVGCALLLPKVVFNHFSATPPPPPRDLLTEVHTLTLQNQQLAGALYVQSQGHAQNAYALEVERTARNVERANSFGAIAYLDAETKRISAEKTHAVNQRGYLEYQYSQLATAKTAVDQQLVLANQNLFVASQQKAQADLRIGQLAHEKAQADLRIGVLDTVVAHRTGENATAALRINELTQEKAVSQMEAQHLTNVLAFRTHERNQAQFRLEQVTHDKAIADIQLTDLGNQLAYKTHQMNVAEYNLATLADEKAFVAIQLSDLGNQHKHQTHQHNVAVYNLAGVVHDKAILDIQLADLGNQLAYKIHQHNVAEYNLANLADEKAFVDIQLADLKNQLLYQIHQNNVTASNLARVTDEKAFVDFQLSDLRNQLLYQTHQKNIAEYTLTEISRDKTIAEIQVADYKNQILYLTHMGNIATFNAAQLTHDNTQLRAGNLTVAALQSDLHIAQARVITLTNDLADIKREKAQADLEIAELKRKKVLAEDQVRQLNLDKGNLQALVAKHPDVARLQHDLDQAQTRIREVETQIGEIKNEKQQAELKAAGLDSQVKQLTHDKEELQALLTAHPDIAKLHSNLEQAEERVRTLTEDFDRVFREKDTAVTSIQRLTDEKTGIVEESERIVEHLKKSRQAHVIAQQAFERIKSEKKEVEAQVDRLSEQFRQMSKDLLAATQAKNTAESEKSSVQILLDTAKEEQSKLQSILAVKPLKEIHTSQDLALALGSMQKADLTRLPQDLPVHQILHETDDHLRSMHNQKQTLEVSFTKATSDNTIADNDKVVFQVDGSKFTDGELIFAHLSTHSPDKESKKNFPSEVLGLVHIRQQMLDKYVLPYLKDKLDAPNLGLTIEQANSPVTITITTHVDRTQPVTMTIEKKYLLKKHGDEADPSGAAQISGIMTLTLHKPNYEGLIQRRIQNPDEKVTGNYKIEKINVATVATP